MNERGQATIFVLGIFMFTSAVAGLAIDGTRVFLLRRTLQNAADAAALAGAAELDRPALYRSGGEGVRLDPLRARAIASDWLARRGVAERAMVTSSSTAVEVTLLSKLPATFLRVVGIRDLTVSTSARAEPLLGSP